MNADEHRLRRLDRDGGLYEIPDSWVWCELKELTFNITKGSTPTSYGFEYKRKGIRFVKTENIDEIGNIGENTDYIDEEANQFLKRSILNENDILFSIAGTIGRIGIVRKGNLPANTNQALAIIRFFSNEFNVNYFFYLFKSPLIYSKALKSRVGVGRANISLTDLKYFKIPLPPLNEQHRIVDKIEELFTRLDVGVEGLEKAKRQIKQYRQSVLKYALEGKLTEKWRREHGAELEPASVLLEKIRQERKKALGKKYKELPPVDVKGLPELPEGWEWVRLGNCSYGVAYGSAKKSLKSGKIPVLRMGNIQNCFFDWNDLVYTNDEEEIQKYILKNNDVLFNRTNSPELVGKTAIYLDEQPAVFAGYLIRANQVNFISAKFLNYFLNSYIAKVYGNSVKTDGVNQSNINGTKLSNYPYPLCSETEQHQIVQQIETHFSIADHLEKTIDDSLAKSKHLRQSILKKAFKGRLVPQDPDDEPAAVLLERIKKEKERLKEKCNQGKKRKAK